MEVTPKCGILALDPSYMRKQPQPHDIDIAIRNATNYQHQYETLSINNKQQKPYGIGYYMSAKSTKNFAAWQSMKNGLWRELRH